MKNKFEKRVTRRQAREWAVQMLVAAEHNPPENLEEFVLGCWPFIASLDHNDGGMVEVDEIMRDFTEERVRGVMTNLAEIDGTLAELLENWDLQRLGSVERAVLRLGIWEMRFTDVPPPVIINEAVDLSNWFSTPKSRTLINGVLDRYAKSR